MKTYTQTITEYEQLDFDLVKKIWMLKLLLKYLNNYQEDIFLTICLVEKEIVADGIMKTIK